MKTSRGTRASNSARPKSIRTEQLALMSGAVFDIPPQVRSIYNKDLAVQEAKRNVRQFDAGQVVMREGSRIKDMFIIKTGKVKLEHLVDGKPVQLATLGVGEKQFTSVTALEKTTIYRLNLEDLRASAGGQETPVALVLVNLTKKLQQAGKKLAAADIRLN